MDIQPFKSFVSKYRKILNILYAFIVFSIAILALNKIGTKEYWLILICTGFAFYLIESFLIGRTISLSVYHLPAGKNAFYSILRTFWFCVGIALLLLAISYAFNLSLPQNT